MRPALKYNGGKWLLAPWVISHFPPHSSFVDVFTGGGSIVLRKPRSQFEYMNDIDGRVANFFRQIRDNPLRLIRKIKWTPYARDTFDTVKNAQKSEGIEGAYNFFTMNWLAHYADNTKPSFRVRGNQSKEGNYNPAGLFAQTEHLFEIAERLRGVHIENLEYATFMRHHDHKDTLFYCDPPYLGSTRTTQNLYKFELVTPLQHARFLRVALSMHGMVIISGYKSELYDRLLKKWTQVTIQTRDNARNERTEVLYINPLAVSRMPQQDLFNVPSGDLMSHAVV